MYRLSGTDELDFTIDSETGALTLVDDPDHETTSSYSVTITAFTREGETDVQSAPQAVSVKVVDQNDEPPDFAATGMASVDENSGAGRVVYTPAAAVPDVSGDDVVYRLSGTDELDFTIDSETGALTLVDDPDHETTSSYSVTITAFTREGETDVQSAPQAVSVKVVDQNDEPPDFAATGMASVDENSGAGRVVYTPAAAVPDVSGDDVVYRLSGTDELDFTIDSETGALTLVDDPDHETTSSYSVTITAFTREGETDVQSAPQAVSVKVVDQNDEPPDFAATGMASVDENSGAGRVVYTPAAAVPDVSGDDVVYRLSGTDELDFTIDSETGALTLVDDPDHETTSSYSVTITAFTREGED